MSVVALVLAAGRGTRFGSDKRRATLADGRSLLAHSVERARAVFDDVRVVLREGERGEDLGLPGDCRVIASPDAGLGMGHSLAAGVASLVDSDAQAVAILLGYALDRAGNLWAAGRCCGCIYHRLATA